jgi:hypothetical protein
MDLQDLLDLLGLRDDFDIACWKGEIETVRKLLPTTCEKHLSLGLHYAFERKHHDIIHYVLSLWPGDSTPPYPLGLACLYNDLELVEEFIKTYPMSMLDPDDFNDDHPIRYNTTLQIFRLILANLPASQYKYLGEALYPIIINNQLEKLELLFTYPIQLNCQHLAIALDNKNLTIASRIIEHPSFLPEDDNIDFYMYQKIMEDQQVDIIRKLLSLPHFRVWVFDDVFDHDRLYYWALKNNYPDIIDLIKKAPK